MLFPLGFQVSGLVQLSLHGGGYGCGAGSFAADVLFESLVVDFLDQICGSFVHQLASDQHVHAIYVHVVQDARVVGDHEQGASQLLLVDADGAGNGVKRVHVKARVGFVQNGQLGL